MIRSGGRLCTHSSLHPTAAPLMAAHLRPDYRALHELAALYGVQRSYTAIDGRRKTASAGALTAVLQVLGAPHERPADAAGAVAARRLELASRPLDPVCVAWEGRRAAPLVRFPTSADDATLDCTLTREDGGSNRWRAPVAGLPETERARLGGRTWTARRLTLPAPLPLGYHHLAVASAGVEARCLVVSAPQRAHPLPARATAAFAPVYALHSERSLGVGDLGDLAALATALGGRGVRLLATLPLLAAFLSEPFEPSPYSPVSRLFWNELFLDVRAVPELERSAPARALLESRPFAAEAAALAAGDLVDYAPAAALKRSLVERLAETFFADPGARAEAFEGFLQRRPRVRDYARFRTERERSGEAGERYHLYAQWVTDEQVAATAAAARAAGTGLVFDLPIGCHREGFDVRDPAYAAGVSVGAPPDPLFEGGQDWGFPPLHPERLRASGYRYLIEALRHHLAHAAALRIDHVMGFHRLFWIPAGRGAAGGVYVRYPHDELWAVVALESARHRAAIVGENLGTVPAAVNRRLARHGVAGIHVAQLSLDPDAQPPLPPPRPGDVAALNTHDMPPFAAWWHGDDIADRRALGLLDEAGEARERARRTADRRALADDLRRRRLLTGEGPADALHGSLRHLARSDAAVALAALEDLWLERRPQNVPGTHLERPNWRRRLRYDLDRLRRAPEVGAGLAALGETRGGNGP
jgi:4-alpha-glucanotransferase